MTSCKHMLDPHLITSDRIGEKLAQWGSGITSYPRNTSNMRKGTFIVVFCSPVLKINQCFHNATFATVDTASIYSPRFPKGCDAV